mmetsp:Transcript_56771/g.182361  ORF Transcript_56771/g.182361 Transcript_56771/m.182361 type:complete len:204 (+) Transcript_56771:2068-2679(+)
MLRGVAEHGVDADCAQLARVLVLLVEVAQSVGEALAPRVQLGEALAEQQPAAQPRGCGHHHLLQGLHLLPGPDKPLAQQCQLRTRGAPATKLQGHLPQPQLGAVHEEEVLLEAAGLRSTGRHHVRGTAERDSLRVPHLSSQRAALCAGREGQPDLAGHAAVGVDAQARRQGLFERYARRQLQVQRAVAGALEELAQPAGEPFA